VAALASANATTRLLFGTSLREFLFSGWVPGTAPPSASGPGGTSFSQAVTLAELFGTLSTNTAHQYGIDSTWFPGGLSEVVMTNIRANWMGAAGTYALSAAIPKILVATKVQRNSNKLLKGFGLGSVVQV